MDTCTAPCSPHTHTHILSLSHTIIHSSYLAILPEIFRVLGYNKLVNVCQLSTVLGRPASASGSDREEAGCKLHGLSHIALGKIKTHSGYHEEKWGAWSLQHCLGSGQRDAANRWGKSAGVLGAWGRVGGGRSIFVQYVIVGDRLQKLGEEGEPLLHHLYPHYPAIKRGRIWERWVDREIEKVW